jgi:hypothetical protein
VCPFWFLVPDRRVSYLLSALCPRMLDHASAPSTPRQPNQNGLGQAFDPRTPTYLNTDLVSLSLYAMLPTAERLHSCVRPALQTKPDPRVRAPEIEIAGNDNDAMTAFVEWVTEPHTLWKVTIII